MGPLPNQINNFNTYCTYITIYHCMYIQGVPKKTLVSV